MIDLSKIKVGDEVTVGAKVSIPAASEFVLEIKQILATREGASS